MKRYALPLSIAAGIIILIALMFVGGSKTPNYGGGNATDQPLSAEWVRGNPSSSVQLVEYSDFQCPACAAYYPLIKQLEEKLGSKIAFVYRHYPLFQLHANADIAARAAEAAGKQGKFWEMHDKLFENHSAWVDLLDPTQILTQYAKDLGLKVDQFTVDLSAADVKQAVADDYQRGQKAGIQGTPSFFVNGVKIANPTSVEGFSAVLEAALGGK